MSRSVGLARFIGFLPVQSPPSFEPSPERLRSIELGCLDVSQRDSVDRTLFSSLVGQITHIALLWRPSLSILHAVYSLLQIPCNSLPVWDSVRQELHLVLGILPLLSLRINRPVCPLVLAQDAAGATQDGRCPTGAFCLAVGRFPFSEVSAAALRCEARGRSQLSDTWDCRLQVSDLTWLSTLPRTILPTSWFTPAADWELLLARRWRWPLHINRGEAHAAIVWSEAFTQCPWAAGSICLDLSDNTATVGVLSRGRASPWGLNLEARRRCAIEGAGDVRFSTSWVDTHHMPADAGTRPDAQGFLRIGRPLWMAARLVVEIFAGVAVITSQCAEAGVPIADPWDVLYGPRWDLLVPKNVKKLFALLSSGHVLLAWWGTPCTTLSPARRDDGVGPGPLRCPENPIFPLPHLNERDIQKVLDGNHFARICAEGMIICHEAGGFNVLENPERSQMWQLLFIVQALSFINATQVVVHYCFWGVPWRKPTILAGTLPGLSSLAHHCRGGPRCTFSGLPHQRLAGRAPDGRWWTQHACAYPLGLARDVAALARGCCPVDCLHDASY